MIPAMNPINDRFDWYIFFLCFVQVLQREIEGQASEFVAVGKRCAQWNPRLARNLETRYHRLLLRILEWAFHLEALASKPKVRKSPVTRLQPPSVSVSPRQPPSASVRPLSGPCQPISASKEKGHRCRAGFPHARLSLQRRGPPASRRWTARRWGSRPAVQ